MTGGIRFVKVSYLETSALLSWFFNEPEGAEVRKAVNAADLIVTSDVLQVETERAFRRAFKEKILSDHDYDTLVELFHTHIKESIKTGKPWVSYLHCDEAFYVVGKNDLTYPLRKRGVVIATPPAQAIICHRQ